MAKTKKTVSFTLPIRLLELLDAEAEKRNLSRSKLLTLAIMSELDIPPDQQIEIAI